MAAALIWATVFIASLKLTFFPVYFGLSPMDQPSMNPFYYYCLNGLPLFLVWYFLQPFVHRGALSLAIILFVNVFFYAYYGKMTILGDPVVFSDLFVIRTALGVSDSVLDKIDRSNFYFFFDSIIPLVLWAFLGRSGKGANGQGTNRGWWRTRKVYWVLGLAGLVLYAGAVYFCTTAFHKLSPWMDGARTRSLNKHGPLHSFVMSYRDFYYSNAMMTGSAPSRESVLQAIEYLDSLRSKNVQNEFTGHPGGRMPNIIVVLEESLGRALMDAPRLNALGRNVRPFIESLDGELIYTKYLLSATTRGQTAECEFMILNSVLPQPRFAYAYTHHMDQDYISLPRILKEHGYYTAVFHPNTRSFWHRDKAYQRLGFDRYDSEEHFGPGRKVGLGLGDVDFFRQMAVKLRELPEPYFAFIITLSSHVPFSSLPDDLRKGLADGLNGVPEDIAYYIDNQYYADTALRGFWDEIADIRKDAITVVVGDHTGVSHDEDLTSIGYEFDEEWGASEVLALKFQVPLIISAPFLKDTVRPVKDVVGDQADIAPTILDLLGIPAPPFFIGNSLIRGGDVGVTTAFSDNGVLMMDETRFCDLRKGEMSYDYVLGKKLEKSDCEDLHRRADASLIISRDIVWGKRYSYETGQGTSKK